MNKSKLVLKILFFVLCLTLAAGSCSAEDRSVYFAGTKKGTAVTRTVAGKTETALDEAAKALGCESSEIAQGICFVLNGRKAEIWDNSDIARIDGSMVACTSAVSFSDGHWWTAEKTAEKILSQLSFKAGRKGAVTFAGAKISKAPAAAESPKPVVWQKNVEKPAQKAETSNVPAKTERTEKAAESSGTQKNTSGTETKQKQQKTKAAQETQKTEAKQPEEVLAETEKTQPVQPVKREFKNKRPTVVIDAGHGAHDPGACGHGVREKEINLKAALELGNALKPYGVNVVYTRSTDVFLKLQERTAFANKKNADVFVSLHCNSLPKPNNGINGIEIYLMASPRDKDSLRLAIEENKEISGTANSVADLQRADARTRLLLKILGDMQQNNKISESTQLIEAMHKSIKSRGLQMRKVSQAPFFVLRGAGMPAVLIEMGYLSSASDAERLNNPAYRSRLAAGFAAGIVDYIKTYVKL